VTEAAGHLGGWDAGPQHHRCGRVPGVVDGCRIQPGLRWPQLTAGPVPHRAIVGRVRRATGRRWRTPHRRPATWTTMLRSGGLHSTRSSGFASRSRRRTALRRTAPSVARRRRTTSADMAEPSRFVVAAVSTLRSRCQWCRCGTGPAPPMSRG
jgi:hypothetical protein